jgi:hypothetical protein
MDSSVNIAMGRMTRVQFMAGTREFSLLLTIQTGSGAHPAGGYFSGASPPFSAEVKNDGALPPLSLCLHGIMFD